MEEFIVSSLGLGPDLAEDYRQTVRAQLEIPSNGLLGDLPDPQQFNGGRGDDPVLLFNRTFVHEAEGLRIDGAGIECVFRRTRRNQVLYAGPLGANCDHLIPDDAAAPALRALGGTRACDGGA
jgi:hypothetical protein